MIDIDLIRDAAKLIEPYAVRTPLLESHALNEQTGGRVLIKAENLQKTGSFKFRGAYTKLSRLTPGDRQNGVVAFSSGNHAQGVAMAARLHGIQATIVMPENAPAMKIRNTRELGAEVVLYDPESESREKLGQSISTETGAVLVKPYDDWDVMSGQGTIGLEISRQLDQRSLVPDVVVSPCGGGGLIAGVAVAVHAEHPGCEIFIAEPSGYDDSIRSLKAGRRIANSATRTSTICDAIVTPMPGELTFLVHRQHLTGGFAVDDEEVMQAMRFAYDRFKLVVEPGGAAALAAILKGALELSGKVAVVICSGGNVDARQYARVLLNQELERGEN